MRLGRQGWNNVVIFVVLAMMLLFRLTSDHLNRNDDTSIVNKDSTKSSSAALPSGHRRILPPNAVVLEIDLPQRVIQRVGTGWRSQPDAGRPVITVDAWLHITLPEWTKAIGAGVSGQSIQVYLVNRSSPLQLTLFKKGDSYFITNWQGQLLKLDQVSYNALFSRHP
ncbi:hypothetical protein [Celerinatantimonas yamalensis]|uniref:Uncharacterized protein n=1 Tax=Celerinatantimonas yamalensis TaxID=559956 RepID=A0ABW9GDF0_9GAMM